MKLSGEKYMNVTKITIKEIEQLFKADEVNAELVAACREDERKSVQRLAERYLKQQAKREQELQRLQKMYQYEHEAAEAGYELIAGVDEAGRGPLAGPVSVAAVILPMDLLLPKLNDSKKLRAKVRDELYDEILAKAVTVKQVFVQPKVIDRINILQAVMQGMYEAIDCLQPKPHKVLIDAVKLKDLAIPQLSLIKGDAKSASIAAASIVAKVARDRLMDEYDKKYPEYGFAAHKGYGTAEHIAAIRQHGVCPIHRVTFEPIKSMLKE